jgi:hypothetical protein
LRPPRVRQSTSVRLSRQAPLKTVDFQGQITPAGQIAISPGVRRKLRSAGDDLVKVLPAAFSLDRPGLLV